MPKTFQQLTLRGQLRRLRALAGEVLRDYPVRVRRLRFLALQTNVFFRVDGEDGERYALRVGTAGRHGAEDHGLEIRWLNALKRETDLHVIEPVARHDGGAVTQAALAGTRGALECVLFRWVPGRPLTERLSSRTYHNLGRAMARLHEHAASFPLEPGRRPLAWDRVFYRPDEPVLLFGREHRPLFSREDLALLGEVAERADDLLRELAGGGVRPRLLHADLHMGNVHVYRGALHLLDFEDLKWGHPVQDLSVTLFYGRDRPDYSDLRDALREGYETRLPWPAAGWDQIDLLMGARSLRLLNYVLRRQPDPRNYAARVLRRLREIAPGARG